MVWGRSRRNPVFEKANGWIRFCEVVFFPLTRVLGKRRMLGLEHLQVPGPVLVVSNHISHLDPVYTAVYLRKGGRWPHIMAKASLWKIPFVGTVLARTQQVPVVRGVGRGQESLDEAGRLLDEGKMVAIYPDGTISRDPDHWPMKPKLGAAILALGHPSAVVVPVAIWGTQEVLAPYGKKFRPFPRKPVVQIAGPPVPLDDLRGDPHDVRAQLEAATRMMTAIRDLL